MVIEASFVQTVNKTIDATIKQIPVMMSMFRNESLDLSSLVKSESDFILGAAWSQVLNQLAVLFASKYLRPMALDEVIETDMLILKRAYEFKKAIAETGL